MSNTVDDIVGVTEKMSIAPGVAEYALCVGNDGAGYNVLNIDTEGSIRNRTMYLDSETGLWTYVKGMDNAMGVLEYTTMIGAGLIPGHDLFRGFGERTAITNIVTGCDLWQGAATSIPIPNQTTGEQMTVVSTSAADASAGTGVKTLDIHGLDITGNPQQEVITLAGVTPVNTVRTNWRFIQSIHAETVGTGGAAAGTISIYKTGAAATVYNVLVPGGNMSLNSSRMVPFDKILYITNFSIMAADNTSVSVRCRATSTFEDTVTPGYFFLFKDVSILQNSTREKSFKVPLKFPALSILKWTAYATSNGAAASVNYDGWIE